MLIMFDTTIIKVFGFPLIKQVTVSKTKPRKIVVKVRKKALLSDSFESSLFLEMIKSDSKTTMAIRFT